MDIRRWPGLAAALLREDVNLKGAKFRRQSRSRIRSIKNTYVASGLLRERMNLKGPLEVSVANHNVR